MEFGVKQNVYTVVMPQYRSEQLLIDLTDQKARSKPVLWLNDTFADRIANVILVQGSFARNSLGDAFSLSAKFLSPYRDKFSAPRLAEFSLGRRCAELALRTLGTTSTSVGINTDGSPDWPGCVGSITHSVTEDEISAAVAVANREDYSALGIDYENVPTPDYLHPLLTQVLTAGERERLPHDPIPQLWAATLIFSLKESLYKAIHPVAGIPLGYRDAELVRTDNAARIATLRITRDLSARWPENCRVTAHYRRPKPNSILTLVAIK